MNINKISVPTKIKALALGTLLCGSVAMCHQEKNNYVNALKDRVKENVEPEVYQHYENQATQFSKSEEDVFRKAYDSIQLANRNYFEGSQNVRSFE